MIGRKIYKSPFFLKEIEEEIFNNKTVVIINLSGGNDGLNTVIPYTNDIYYSLRPNIGISDSLVLPISNTLGLHPEMATLQGA